MMALRRVRLNADSTYVMVVAFVVSLSYVGSGFSRTFSEPSDLDPRIVKIVQSVSEDRLVAILKKLESFGTRSTLSSTDAPDRGIGAAREWILKEMASYSLPITSVRRWLCMEIPARKRELLSKHIGARSGI